uniref:Structural protein VP1 n=1 Tax=Phylloscopus inornatus ambidensovirus TaxID=2794452 RepID=A0A8E7G268_9VIRU|nr:MAG: putative structural protein VP1 [Phylloscopus inornatus ambidensovirus]
MSSRGGETPGGRNNSLSSRRTKLPRKQTSRNQSRTFPRGYKSASARPKNPSTTVVNLPKPPPPLVSGKGTLFPGYNYLGPGNPLDNGEPVNEVDDIAKQHDIAYENAYTPKQINKADIDAIAKFKEHILGSHAVAATAGYTGLTAKRDYEALAGVVYPSSATLKSHAVKRMRFIKYALSKKRRQQ